MTDEATLPVDENQLIAERRGKLKHLREQGVAFPNDFRRAHYAGSRWCEQPALSRHGCARRLRGQVHGSR